MEQGKKISILGGGESGVGAALLAKAQGFEVFLSDKGKIKEQYKTELNDHAIPYEEGQHSQEVIFQAVEIIKSPGIPDSAPLIVEANAQNIPVISEIEFAGRYTQAKIIGITGSNGKTTTTELIYHLLKTAGLKVGKAGNVGYSFARSVLRFDFEYYVLELSSFQLDGIVHFRPDIALLLNISPDHLDRYDYQMDNYVRSKFRIIENQLKENAFLYNEEDPWIKSHLSTMRLTPEAYGLGRSRIKDRSIRVDGCVYDMSRSRLRGLHNFLNALFAAKTAHLLSVDPKIIQLGLESFEPVPHRLEVTGEVNGVEYINDSKATNVDAVYYALEAMERPVIWILGGQDKGNDYDPLLDLAAQKVKAIVCLGIDNRKIIEAFREVVDLMVETRGAEEAVRKAAGIASPGDVVLLSPACASFDLFKNYIDRGDQFREAVQKLT